MFYLYSFLYVYGDLFTIVTNCGSFRFNCVQNKIKENRVKHYKRTFCYATKGNTGSDDCVHVIWINIRFVSYVIVPITNLLNVLFVDIILYLPVIICALHFCQIEYDSCASRFHL